MATVTESWVFTAASVAEFAQIRDWVVSHPPNVNVTVVYDEGKLEIRMTSQQPGPYAWEA